MAENELEVPTTVYVIDEGAEGIGQGETDWTEEVFGAFDRWRASEARRVSGRDGDELTHGALRAWETRNRDNR